MESFNNGHEPSEDELVHLIGTIIDRATDALQDFLSDSTVYEISSYVEVLGKTVAEAIDKINYIRKVASIPTKLFMNKFVRYCRGLTDIPLEKRQKYLKQLGKEKFNRENIFVLNDIQKIEEEEKLPLFIKLLEAKMDSKITDSEYKRLMILTNRTLYSDLVYMRDHITADPIALQNDADYGLVSSGLLVTAGNEVLVGDPDGDTGIRFNYTVFAKQLANIFFGVTCSLNPTNANLGITTMSENDILQSWNNII